MAVTQPAVAISIMMGDAPINYIMAPTNPVIMRLYIDEQRFPNPIIGQDAQGGLHTLKPFIDTITLQSAADYSPPNTQRFPDMLNYGRVAYGKHDIYAAYFTDAVNYPSANLGVKNTASTLNVRLNTGDLLSFRLPSEFVFEAVSPMVIDLNADGLEEVIAVRTNVEQQASSLAVFFPVEGALTLVAATAQLPRGQWLNPVGAADFRGNGKTQIAVVNSPRANSYLELYEFFEGQLVLEQRFYGYSNHVYGTTIDNASIVVDFNQDGRADIISASNDLQTLSILTNRDGRFAKLLDIPLRAYVRSGFYLTRVTRDVPLDVVFLLDNGQVAVLSRQLLDW